MRIENSYLLFNLLVGFGFLLVGHFVEPMISILGIISLVTCLAVYIASFGKHMTRRVEEADDCTQVVVLSEV